MLSLEKVAMFAMPKLPSSREMSCSSFWRASSISELLSLISLLEAPSSLRYKKWSSNGMFWKMILATDSLILFLSDLLSFLKKSSAFDLSNIASPKLVTRVYLLTLLLNLGLRSSL